VAWLVGCALALGCFRLSVMLFKSIPPKVFADFSSFDEFDGLRDWESFLGFGVQVFEEFGLGLECFGLVFKPVLRNEAFIVERRNKARFLKRSFITISIDSDLVR
jgi:hypothetical protein